MVDSHQQQPVDVLMIGAGEYTAGSVCYRTGDCLQQQIPLPCWPLKPSSACAALWYPTSRRMVCRFVQTAYGAAADKPAGVVALTCFDLRRFGKVKRLWAWGFRQLNTLQDA